MQSAGIVKKLDKLGRITLSRELREVMELRKKDSVELIPNGSTLIIRKHTPTVCVFCGNADGITIYKGKYICTDCTSGIKAINA